MFTQHWMVGTCWYLVDDTLLMQILGGPLPYENLPLMSEAGNGGATTVVLW